MTVMPPVGPADCMIDYCRMIRRKDAVVSIEVQEALEIGMAVRQEKRPPADLAEMLRRKAKACRQREPVIAAWMDLTANNLDGTPGPVHWWQKD